MLPPKFVIHDVFRTAAVFLIVDLEQYLIYNL
jgi:hypothetical protein